MEVKSEIQDFRSFMGKQGDKYIKKWGIEQGAVKPVSWNWSAFLFNWLWFGYRKMYFYTFLFIVWVFIYDTINYFTNMDKIITLIQLGLMVTLGMISNWLYYIHIDKKIIEIKSMNIEPDKQDKLMVKTGGISWGSVIGAFLFLIFTLFVYNYGLIVAFPQVK